jgi:hypothetical protein
MVRRAQKSKLFRAMSEFGELERATNDSKLNKGAGRAIWEEGRDSDLAFGRGRQQERIRLFVLKLCS